MYSILHSLRRRSHHHHRENHRTLVDVAAIKWVGDRGLDHAVEREKDLRPTLHLKNLIKSEPSKSLPLSIISQNRESLGIPTRPIDFIRKYPSVFEEFQPGGLGIRPHVKLTPEILGLDSEEQLIHQSHSFKQELADRLLKLLMLAQINKIPLHIIDSLKWDLGLPQDYIQTLVPEFPDYFQVTGDGDSNHSSLELVCWSRELAVSVMENKAMKTGYEKGMPISFPLQYSRGFEIDKKFKKWVDQWQKLPYISPYENALQPFSAKSDEADKWAVGVLHEILCLLVPKKTDRENVLCLGEYLGLRSRFKRALLHHPGIFYLSSKIGMHTVVLRDGYKRNLLIENHTLMDMRYKYIHLMHSVKEDKKPKSVQGGSTQQQKPTHDSKGEVQEDEQDGELHGLSDSEIDDVSEDAYDEEEDEDEIKKFSRVNAGGNRDLTRRNPEFRAKRSLKTSVGNSFDRRYPNNTRKTEPTEVSRRTVMQGRGRSRGRSPGRSEFLRNRGRSNLDSRTSA